MRSIGGRWTDVSTPTACSLLLTLALSFACSPRSTEHSAPHLPRPTRGYILISLDTLRADHLGCYGYPLDTSPFLDRLSRRGALFENAVVQYPSTLTSHMSIFTGLYPGQHGVFPPEGVLSEEIPTLPALFLERGFRTAAYTEGGFLRARFGFRRGFEIFGAHDRSHGEEVERTFMRGVRFLRSLEEDERFFLFLHTYAVHAPYQPPAEHLRSFWSGDPPEGAFSPTGPELAQRSAESLDGEVVRWLAALYDAEIHYLDSVLEDFFQQLDDLGLSEEVTVIVTSDHGEELKEHGRLNHDQLYDEVLHVPLILLHPEIEPGLRSRHLVESVDLAPTLLELAGRERPEGLPGHNLFADLRKPAPDEPEASQRAYAEASYGRRALYAREQGRLWHYLVLPRPGTPGELFELTQDRRELVDRRAEESGLVAQLAEELAALERQARVPAVSLDLDQDTRERLEALGYVVDSSAPPE